MFDKKILGYLISGGKRLRKMKDQEIIDFMNWVYDVFEDVEYEIERPLNDVEKQRIIKLILGIQQKHGYYDERYHKYLLGRVINNKN